VVLICQWDDWSCCWQASNSIQGRIFMSARIRSNSRFKRFLCSILIDIRCFRLPLGVRVPQVEYHCCRLSLMPRSTMGDTFLPCNHRAAYVEGVLFIVTPLERGCWILFIAWEPVCPPCLVWVVHGGVRPPDLSAALQWDRTLSFCTAIETCRSQNA
jgi:hypothetical protein